MPKTVMGRLMLNQHRVNKRDNKLLQTNDFNMGSIDEIQSREAKRINSKYDYSRMENLKKGIADMIIKEEKSRNVENQL